jgi:hypothetical protein
MQATRKKITEVAPIPARPESRLPSFLTKLLFLKDNFFGKPKLEPFFLGQEQEF